ncbi:DNA-binding XRE family transcriptional regulator [Pontibacter ummariensis]|uniref:DNA-binding transcriptional regulator, XRE-family HTH domain n=1 Tax=Pontibacter ummariensis TaxID=1610492 RepID=A0A239IW49_9BACT|nr:helix-turn-helix transcriptional regulator [Pontibacter ummariensis]PRY08966.1 DNA-binding XRE family transcriptional regulator [Pontibacter ummariensis]SNS97233.1 DNA-binding transcriptional regulator, XRE-family HTH domain [Pontibacter ummariensis]
MSEHLTLGSRIKAFRKSKKLSGEELGAVIGVGRGQVSSIENDKSQPTLEGCIKLASSFPELDINWLLTGKGEMLVSQDLSNGDCWPLLQAEKEKLKAERNKSEALEALLVKHGIIKL